jgi:hypothetical protein
MGWLSAMEHLLHVEVFLLLDLAHNSDHVDWYDFQVFHDQSNLYLLSVAHLVPIGVIVDMSRFDHLLFQVVCVEDQILGSDYHVYHVEADD